MNEAMPIKYVVYRRKNNYGWVSYLELEEHDDVLLDRDIRNRVLYKINDIHSAAKTNKFFTLPFQSIWFHSYVDESKLLPSDEIFFVFEEGSRQYLLGDYLKYLKKKYPNSHLVFSALNSSFTYPKKRLKFIEENYDFITSFDKKDCEERGWWYYGTTYSKLSDVSPDGVYETDVFFAGANKGRLNLLYEIYNRLSQEGVSCEFYVTGVKKEDIRVDFNIHYNEWLDYREIVKKSCKARCLLEIVQEGQHGESYRQGEAVTYGIKLLTNFEDIKSKEYYNTNQFFVFKTAEEIDVDFIKSSNMATFPYNGCLSPYKRLMWLEKQYQKQHIK